MDHDARLVEIETRLAFQELALSELSDLVNQQRLGLEALRHALAQTSAELGSLRDGLVPPAANEPPPHY